MARLFVHVGPAKTGTSALQHALLGHDGSVVIYPKVGLWADGSHHNLVLNAYADFRREDVVRADPTALFAQVGAAARGSGRNVVISSEALPGGDIGPFVARLVEALGMVSGDVEIVAVCRDHLARAGSLYNQNVKDAFCRERRLPGEFLRTAARQLRYAPMLRRLAASGFAVRALDYHPAAELLPRFLRHVGFATGLELPNETRNVSLSVRGMIALLAANTVAADAAERTRLGLAMRRLKQRFGGAGFIFDAVSVAAVAPVFATDRAELARTWGVSLPEPAREAMANMFFLTAADLAAIEAACRDLEVVGEAIVEIARRHVRDVAMD